MVALSDAKSPPWPNDLQHKVVASNYYSYMRCCLNSHLSDEASARRMMRCGWLFCNGYYTPSKLFWMGGFDIWEFAAIYFSYFPCFVIVYVHVWPGHPHIWRPFLDVCNAARSLAKRRSDSAKKFKVITASIRCAGCCAVMRWVLQVFLYVL